MDFDSNHNFEKKHEQLVFMNVFIPQGDDLYRNS